MKKLKNWIIFTSIIFFFLGFAPNKNPVLQKEAPFTIVEKSYFYYVSGK
jgi:hypothetical protein